MNIFQKSVLQKHLNNLDKDKVDRAFLQFKTNYSPEKIEKIKSLKEEEYQDGFLRDLFVNVLGYTLKPDENSNLVRELKNHADSKKADGAIVARGHAPLTLKITGAIESFNELEYDAFKKELLKQKVKISLGNENNEWREYFITTNQKVNEIQNQINQTDSEIDHMVYDLYELTAEEIEIVENSVK